MDLQTNEKGLYIGTLMKKAKEDDKESYKELIMCRYPRLLDNVLIRIW